jgi:hypothetical protein
MLRIFATEDETWIPFDMVGNKADNKVWIPPQAPRPKVVRPQLTFRKTMLSIVFTGNGKVNMNVSEKGETVNSESYVDFVHQTGDRWRRLRSDPTPLKELLWMQDNARPHSAAATEDFFRKRHVKLVKQSPYSPDFNLCDRWLITELKKGLRRCNLDCAQDVLNASAQIFKQIPEERFRHELMKLKDHCSSVIAAHGEYITK